MTISAYITNLLWQKLVEAPTLRCMTKPDYRDIELYKACYPGQEANIGALFADGEPPYDTVDALGLGNTYALLCPLLLLLPLSTVDFFIPNR